MIVLAGADLVLHDRVLPGASILINDGVIETIDPITRDRLGGATLIDVADHFIVPGFIDVHVHGIEGIDVLEDAAAVGRVAERLPKFGVTAFCPTTVACESDRLQTFLQAAQHAQSSRPERAARVIGAHLESNFINADWKGAQPPSCLRVRATGGDVLEVIERFQPAIAIVTLAPELPGGIALVRDLVKMGIRVSIGHSGATYEEAKAAIEAGARHATHLFNRMSSITSRSPGVVGAVLESNAVSAEIICDGHHVHPSLVSLAIRTKSISRVMAITDGTAAAGMPIGSRARLGDQVIVAGERTAVLEDGTLAGSVLTMDGAFRALIGWGLTLPEAARMCASTPAEALGLHHMGAIAAGNRADLVVLDRNYRVKQTYIEGRLIP